MKDTKLTLRRENREGEFPKQKKVFEVSVFVGRVSASPGGRNPTVRDELGGLIFRVKCPRRQSKIRHRPKQIHPNETQRR